MIPTAAAWIQGWSFAAVSLALGLLVARRRRDAFGKALITVFVGNALIGVAFPFFDFTSTTTWNFGGYFVVLAIDALTLGALLALPWLVFPSDLALRRLRVALIGYAAVVVAALALAVLSHVALARDAGTVLLTETYGTASWLAFGFAGHLAFAIGAVRFFHEGLAQTAPAPRAQLMILALAFAGKLALTPPTLAYNLRVSLDAALPLWRIILSGLVMAGALGWLAARALRALGGPAHRWALGMVAFLVSGVALGVWMWTDPVRLGWLFGLEPQLIRPLLLGYGVLRWRIIDVPDHRTWAYVLFLGAGASVGAATTILRVADGQDWPNPWVAALVAGAVTAAAAGLLLAWTLTRRRWGGMVVLPPSIQGQYKPGAVLHLAATATVAAARHRKTGQRVVLKWATDGHAARIDREASALRAVAGPGVMPLLTSAAGVLVMPRLRHAHRIGRDELQPILGHLESRGWVHGDLSHENLYRDASGLVVGDFSIARPVGESWNGAFGRGAAATPNQQALGPASFEDDRIAAAALVRA